MNVCREGEFMIKRIIFDIDGTLITGIDFEPFLNKALKKYGINDLIKVKQFLFNIKEYEKIYNCYNKDLYLDFFSKRLNIKLDYQFLEILFYELKEAIPKNSENIKNILKNLSDYELVLLSNYFEESQRNRLVVMGINDFFSAYYGEKIIKPNELAYKSAQGMYKSYECLIVGDDKKLDIDIPKKLGFKTIYVNKKGDINSVEELSPKLIKKIEK